MKASPLIYSRGSLDLTSSSSQPSFYCTLYYNVGQPFLCGTNEGKMGPRSGVNRFNSIESINIVLLKVCQLRKTGKNVSKPKEAKLPFIGCVM